MIACLFVLASCNTAKHREVEVAEINHKTRFSSSTYGVKGSPRVTISRKVKKGGGRYQVGKPYKIRGKWYYPKEQADYDRTGVASWYGPNFHGRLTANGEIYNQYALSAAHPTLPLPSYAHVTNLENGSSVIVRINDRGPFSSNRIIDLSAQASKLLDYQKKGLARVRVRYLGKARMDGLDEEYLMASYRRPENPETPLSLPVMTAFASDDVIPGKAVARVIRAPTPSASLTAAFLSNKPGNELFLEKNPLKSVKKSTNFHIASGRAIPKPVQVAYRRPVLIVTAIGDIPVPAMRPGSFQQELSINLSPDTDGFVHQLKPLG